MKVTPITINLLVKDDIAKKHRKKLAADVQAAVQGALDTGDFPKLNNDNVEAFAVAYVPYNSEVRGV